MAKRLHVDAEADDELERDANGVWGYAALEVTKSKDAVRPLGAPRAKLPVSDFLL